MSIPILLRRALAIIALIIFAPPTLAAETAAPPQPILFQHHGQGEVLTDSGGLTLYTYVRDPAGKSACVGACVTLWPPVSATPDAIPSGDWSVITRDDGQRQWAFRSKALYRSLRDTAPGDTNGEEFNGLWRVAIKPIPLPAGFSVGRTALGQVLVDQSALTLYARDNDTATDGGCDATCTRTWTPAVAPGMAHPVGPWTIVKRGDGSRQWAFQDHPLYHCDQDVYPGDTSCDTPAKGWHAVVLDPPPPKPAWVTVQSSDSGEVFGDAQGRTLYTFNATSRATSTEIETAAPKDWLPVLAQSGDRRVGSWVPIPREGNALQWSYRGMALFTNTNDLTPGDLLGVRSGDLRFAVITRTGLPMQGIGQ